MITPLEALGLLFAVLIILSILKIQQNKEQANRLASRFCQQHGLQLLDGTVAFRGLHLARPGLFIAMNFQFEYSVNKIDRYPGSISLVGKQVQAFHIAAEHTHPPESVDPSDHTR